MGLHLADYFILIIYFLGITAIGIWSARKIKSSSDFFMPRKFGKAMMIMFSFGTGTHSDQAVLVASKSFTNGLSGIWYQWLWLPVTPFYWLIAPIFRRFRAITTANVFEARFSPSVAMLYAVLGMLNLMVNIGVMLKGSSEVLSASTSGLVSANWAICLMTIIFVIYGVAGGLSAAIITDFIQGMLTIIFSFLLLPLVLNAIGGLEGMRSGITDPQMLSLVAPAEISLFYIVVIAINALVGIVTQPHTMGNCAAGKTEMEGRIGFMGGTLIKRLCTIPWCLTGVAAVIYFAGREIEPDKVFGTVAGEFLPKIMPGVLGIFIAAVLASVMSSCDVFMISSSALFTEDIYKRLKPNEIQKHYILVGRITSMAVVIGGVLFAYWLPDIVAGLEIFWKISAMMGIAFWVGLFWRRFTTAGAWAGTLISFAVLIFTSKIAFGGFILWDFNQTLVHHLPSSMIKEGKLELPWQMIFYLVSGILSGIFVSLFTKPVAREKLDNFYALIRTPIAPGEQISSPCTLPADAVVPEKRVIFPNSNLEFMIPSLTSVIGFLAGWGCVAAIIYAVFLITKV